jgi:hypothetical protein
VALDACQLAARSRLTRRLYPALTSMPTRFRSDRVNMPACWRQLRLGAGSAIHRLRLIRRRSSGSPFGAH